MHPVAISSDNRQGSNEEESWKEMVKSCCAFGCANRYYKSAGIAFYRFPTDAERKRMWIVAVNRKDWAPSEYSWIYGEHLVSGCKSNDPASPDYVPSVFDHVKSPPKRRLLSHMSRYEERRALKRRRANDDRRSNDARACAAQSLLQLSESCTCSQYCEPYTGTASSTAMTMQLQDTDLWRETIVTCGTGTVFYSVNVNSFKWKTKD